MLYNVDVGILKLYVRLEAHFNAENPASAFIALYYSLIQWIIHRYSQLRGISTAQQRWLIFSLIHLIYWCDVLSDNSETQIPFPSNKRILMREMDAPLATHLQCKFINASLLCIIKNNTFNSISISPWHATCRQDVTTSVTTIAPQWWPFWLRWWQWWFLCQWGVPCCTEE